MSDIVKIIFIFMLIYIGYNLYNGTLENPFAKEEKPTSLMVTGPSGKKPSMNRVNMARKSLKQAQANLDAVKRKYGTNNGPSARRDIQKAQEQVSIAEYRLKQAEVDLQYRQ